MLIYKKKASSQEPHYLAQSISLNHKGKVEWNIDGLVAGRFGCSHVFFVLYEGGRDFRDHDRRESLSLCIHEQGSSIVENFSIPKADPMFKTKSHTHVPSISYPW